MASPAGFVLEEKLLTGMLKELIYLIIFKFGLNYSELVQPAKIFIK